jgi:hypothetical protein
MAANFLVVRNEGNYATGNITVFTANPQQISVPRGTVFSTDDNIEFVTLSDYTGSRAALQYNREEYPLYNSDDIPIRARVAGDGFNVDVGQISKSVNWGGTAAKISNRAPITGGQIRETNIDLVTRIQDSIHGANMSSVAGIKKLLNTHFPSIAGIEVTGAGHPLMHRDLSLLTSAIDNYIEEDYYMVYSGITGSLAKKHKAY